MLPNSHFPMEENSDSEKQQILKDLETPIALWHGSIILKLMKDPALSNWNEKAEKTFQELNYTYNTQFEGNYSFYYIYCETIERAYHLKQLLTINTFKNKI